MISLQSNRYTKKQEPASPSSRRSRLCALGVRLFASCHLQLYDTYPCFLFALRTKEGEVEENCVSIYFRPRFLTATWTAHPQGLYLWRVICLIIHHTFCRRAQPLMAKGVHTIPISTGTVMSIQGIQTPFPKM